MDAILLIAMFACMDVLDHSDFHFGVFHTPIHSDALYNNPLSCGVFHWNVYAIWVPHSEHACCGHTAFRSVAFTVCVYFNNKNILAIALWSMDDTHSLCIAWQVHIHGWFVRVWVEIHWWHHISQFVNSNIAFDIIISPFSFIRYPAW